MELKDCRKDERGHIICDEVKIGPTISEEEQKVVEEVEGFDKEVQVKKGVRPEKNVNVV